MLISCFLLGYIGILNMMAEVSRELAMTLLFLVINDKLYSVKVLYLTFLTNPTGSLNYYKNAHESDIFISLPLVVLPNSLVCV